MIPLHLTAALSSAVDTEIDHASRHGAAGRKSPIGEVGFVACVLFGVVAGIASARRPILRPYGYSVRMTGVFCHQSSRASFTDTSGTLQVCELSDLLVVAEDLTAGSAGNRWAGLVHAKMANAGGGTTLLARGDLGQLDLMKRWPPVALPSAYVPAVLDFTTCPYTGNAIERGRYRLIEPRPNLEWRRRAPAKLMRHAAIRWAASSRT